MNTLNNIHFCNIKKNQLFILKTECRPGYYGKRCGHLCNGYCMNNGICNHVDGVCLAGCQDGYIGKHCNNCKAMFKYSRFTFFILDM